MVVVVSSSFSRLQFDAAWRPVAIVLMCEGQKLPSQQRQRMLLIKGGQISSLFGYLWFRFDWSVGFVGHAWAGRRKKLAFINCLHHSLGSRCCLHAWRARATAMTLQVSRRQVSRSRASQVWMSESESTRNLSLYRRLPSLPAVSSTLCNFARKCHHHHSFAINSAHYHSRASGPSDRFRPLIPRLDR